MKNMKRIVSLLLVALMIVGIVMTATACGSKDEIVDGTIVLKDGKTYGSGKTSFNMVVTDKEGKSVKVTVKTDKATVGEALVENQLVAGETSEWGLMVNTINGITCDYSKDSSYWAFYIDGEYAMTGVDSTEVTAGATYTFVVETY